MPFKIEVGFLASTMDDKLPCTESFIVRAMVDKLWTARTNLAGLM